MSVRVRWLPQARIQYRDAVSWISHRSAQGADTVRHQVRRALVHIQRIPRAAPISVWRVEARQVPAGKYLIFYTVHDGYVLIEELRHGAQDLTQR